MDFLIFILAIPVIDFILLVVSIVQFYGTNEEDIEKRKSLKKQIKTLVLIIVAWFGIIGGLLLLAVYSIAVGGM